MKTDVIVRIDCNKKTCGKCVWIQHGFFRRYCLLYFDKKDQDYTELKVRGPDGEISMSFRCEQCLKGELRP